MVQYKCKDMRVNMKYEELVKMFVDAYFWKPSRRKKPSNMGRKELVSR